ncbi:Itc1 protein [Martiniozyma asiatica (nom. inval.)]|nr:Itc1 protein [Martiniozyma asiatica]
MVLYKRKVVPHPPLEQSIEDDVHASTPVFYIPETGEVFTSYQSFLDRLSFYNTKNFVSETSGNSHSTFFQALQVENMERQMMENNFPEPVKEPILRFVMVMAEEGAALTRLDNLVDHIYNKFKDEFFPGDQVLIRTVFTKDRGTVKEKVRFESFTKANGEVVPGKTNYRVLLEEKDQPASATVVTLEPSQSGTFPKYIDVDDPSCISRERNSFTKAYVKTFLKLSLVRATRFSLPGKPLSANLAAVSSQTPTPWVLKPEVAKLFKISVNDLWYESRFYQDPKRMHSLGTPKKLTSTMLTTPSTNNIATITNPVSTTTSKSTTRGGSGAQSLPSSVSATSNLNSTITAKQQNNVLDDTDIFRERRRPLMFPAQGQTSHNISHLQVSQTDPNDTEAMFANLKETPPQDEAKHQIWLQYWYKTLKKVYAFVEIDSKPDKNRDKVIKMLNFAGVTILNEFDPKRVHLIISTRPFSMKFEYDKSDPFWFAMHGDRRVMKVWHYEKCQRFFKSIKISSRKIEQHEKMIKLDEKVKDMKENGQDISDEATNKLVKSDGNINDSHNRNGNGIDIDNHIDNHMDNHMDIDNDNNIDNNNDNDNANNAFGDVNRTTSTFTDTNNNKKKNNNSSTNSKESNKSRAGVTNVSTTESNDNLNEKKKSSIVDDIELPVTGKERPNWFKFNDSSLCFKNSIYEIQISDYLDIYVFLVTFHKPLILDTITFDDFLTALKSDQWCTLLVEILCAMERIIMDKDWEITFPVDISLDNESSSEENDDEDDEDESEDNDNEDENDVESENENGDDKIKNEIEEEDEEEEEEEEEDVTHNAYSIISGSGWVEDLKRRNFKNSKWLTILLGILSKVEYVGHYTSIINEIYEILAPLSPHDTPTINKNVSKKKKKVEDIWEITPEIMEEYFWIKLPIHLRVGAFKIMMELVLTSNTIRSYIDDCMEQSSSLRREKLELAKESKQKNEELKEIEKSIDENIINSCSGGIEGYIWTLNETDKEKCRKEWKIIIGRATNGENLNYSRKSVHSISKLEQTLSPGNTDLLELLNKRGQLSTVVKEIKFRKEEIDEKLNEFNCSRVRMLGKDRVWNRYWWFERNGMPNLTGGKHKDDETHQEKDNITEKKDTNNNDNDDVNENERGNNNDGDDNVEDGDNAATDDDGDDDDDDDDDDDNDDDNDDDDNDDDDDDRWDNETYLLGRLWIQGPSAQDLIKLKANNEKGLERKKFEEVNSQLLMTENDWAYIDNPSEVMKLITYLNDKGIREKALKKELVENQSGIKASLIHRMKFWKTGDMLTVAEFLNELENGKAEVTIKVEGDHDFGAKENYQKGEKNSTDRIDEDKYSDKDNTSDGENRKRKRKYENNEEVNELRKRTRSSIDNNEEISVLDGLELLPLDANVDEREEMIRKAKKRLQEVSESAKLKSVKEWLNSSAIEKFGFSLYEGPKDVGKKKKGKPNKKKK